MNENGIEVKCYSGQTYAERPESFKWHGIEYPVQEIIKSWQEPGERHFRVRTRDNRIFHLVYLERTGKWSLILP